jgi:hypothetical protein
MSGNLTARRPFTQRGNTKPQTLPAILLVLVLVLETIHKNEDEDENDISSWFTPNRSSALPSGAFALI